MAEERYVIWGSAGHAKVLASMVHDQGARVIALFDNSNVPAAIPGTPLYIGEAGFRRWLASARDVSIISGLVAIGGDRGRDRLAIQRLLLECGLRVPSLVHPNATVDASANLGTGVQVLAGAIVAADARIGSACIVNHHASVDHECELGDGVHVAPGATLCGLVRVGDHALVGAGSVVLPRVTIGEGAVVGAGSVVTRDVAPGTVVVGNPARISRRPNS